MNSLFAIASLAQNLKKLEAEPNQTERETARSGAAASRGGRGGVAMEALLELEKVQRVLSLMSSRGLSHADSSGGGGGADADRFLAQFLLFMVQFLGSPLFLRLYEFNRLGCVGA